MRWGALLCRLAVGVVFVYASLDKLAHPDAFAQAIHHYRLLPDALLHPAALLLPMVEVVIGASLILGTARRGAALLAGILLLVFMGAIGTAVVRGLDISCGCFDTAEGHGLGLELLWRDLGLLVLCLPPWLVRDAGPTAASFFRK